MSTGGQTITITAIVTDATTGKPINVETVTFLAWTITDHPPANGNGHYLVTTDASNFLPGYSYSAICTDPPKFTASHQRTAPAAKVARVGRGMGPPRNRAGGTLSARGRSGRTGDFVHPGARAAT
jgi:hypothetical protein